MKKRVVLHEHPNIGKLLIRVFLIFLLLIMAFPLIWNLISSFKTNTEYMTNPYALPTRLAWENYVRAYSKTNLSTNVWNSFYVVVLTLAIVLVCSVPCAYCLVRYKFIASNLILTLFMAAIFISGSYIIIPLFLQMKDLKMLNSLPALALVYSAFHIPFSVFLLSGYMREIPRDYEEAAVLDGCTAFGVFRHVILPLSRAGISTISILCVMGAWNEFPIALVVITEEAKKTMPVGLANLYEVQKYATDWGALFAALVIVLIPTILLFLIGQKQLLQGLSVGGIKE